MGGHLGLGSAGPAYAFPCDLGWAHSHVWGISQFVWRRWRAWQSWGHQGTWDLSLPLILQQESPVLFTWCHRVPRQKQERAQLLSLSHVSFHIPYIFKSLLLPANAPLAKFMRPSPDSSGGEISSASWWTGRPGMLQFMGSQRVGHDWATELNWTELDVGAANN